MRIKRLFEEHAMSDAELAAKIVKKLRGANREELLRVADLLGVDLRGGNELLKKKFLGMDPGVWNEWPEERRRNWVLVQNPGMADDLRGSNFLRMLTANDWHRALSNIENFLEARQSGYIARLSEAEDAKGEFEKDHGKTWTWVKTDQGHLVGLIQRHLADASPDALKRVWQILVLEPSMQKAGEAVERLEQKLREWGKDKWESMSQHDRRRFLLANSPYPGDLPAVRRFFLVLSSVGWETALKKLPELLGIVSSAVN